MKVCVIKGTLRPISGPSDNVEILKQDAYNSGFNEDEIKIIDADQFFRILEQQQEEDLKNLPTLEDRINALEMLMLEQILGGGS